MSTFEFDFGYTRRLTEADAPALQALYMRCADYFFSTGGLPPEPDEAQLNLAECEHDAGSRKKKFLRIGIFTRDHHLIGTTSIKTGQPSRHDWDLGLLLIDPEYRSRGYGSQFVRALFRHAAQNHCRRMMLMVVARNVRALTFWKRQGFVAIGETGPKPFGSLYQNAIELSYRFLSVRAA